MFAALMKKVCLEGMSGEGIEECLGFVSSLQSWDKSSDIIQMHPFPGHDARTGAWRWVRLLHLSPVGTLQNGFSPTTKIGIGDKPRELGLLGTANLGVVDLSGFSLQL